MTESVKAWSERIIIPTYKIGLPDKNPMFLEKRVYQGSSGVVYPHPVIDRVYDDKTDQEYTAVFLENRYLKIMILPEIGGRLQMAQDKTNGYHFVYYNQVIKPALVGLAGPWISGGIEFNWPQHHRPTTFDPLDWKIEEHVDGSKTVWCSEIEQMFHTKGMHGFVLYPDRAYLEIKVQLYNRTAEPQTFLWWANPAVSVHEDYQSVFPPDVHAVMDHGKRDVSSFPVATGTYYKVNYAPGTDISRYKNIPVPTSFMAYHSDFDFMGDYDYRADAGMLHIANHHVVPGKKQWTWGCGDFGKAWDRNLTDEDGPYIELMCGAYTDNQPDFTWLQPGEEKSFSQIFMPYQQIGPASNANQHAALRLIIEEGMAEFGVYVSAPRTATVELIHNGNVIYSKTARLEPPIVLKDELKLPAEIRAQELTMRIMSDGEALLEYTPLPDEKPEIPSPATSALPPEEIATNEELFLSGLHLEQYRHATYAPEPYYQEALRRDPGDSRCNNAMGLLLYRRGKFVEAETYFRAAIKRQTLRNPNPYDGEAYYNLGLALKMQARLDEAFAAFHKAVWNAAWQDAAYFELARLACRKGQFDLALDYLDRSLQRNGRHFQSRHLRIAILRNVGSIQEARQEIELSLSMDSLEYGASWEQFLISGQGSPEPANLSDVETRIALALDYAHAGFFAEAAQLLQKPAINSPMAAYTLAWILEQFIQPENAKMMYAQAAGLSPDYCFPNRLEDVIILQAAINSNAKDARAYYYLGNFWYAHRRYEEAISCWESARELDPQFPTVWRNLGLAYYNKRSDADKALACFEKAFSLNQQDARVFFELDQLYKQLNRSSQERLENLNRHLHLVEQRDDLSLEFISLHNLIGDYQQAYNFLMQRNFHPWEGGEGKVPTQYLISLVQMARQKLSLGEAKEAIDLLLRTQEYPHNLGEGKLYGAQENNVYYYLGCAYDQLGDVDEARNCFLRASNGLSEPASAMYYNDQPPEMIYYQGLARLKLGQSEEANAIFRRLIDYGRAHLDDDVKMDYFAVSLPDFLVFEQSLKKKNEVHCQYLMGLGALGLGDFLFARQCFDEVLRIDAYHQGAIIHILEIGN